MPHRDAGSEWRLAGSFVLFLLHVLLAKNNKRRRKTKCSGSVFCSGPVPGAVLCCAMTMTMTMTATVTVTVLLTLLVGCFLDGYGDDNGDCNGFDGVENKDCVKQIFVFFCWSFCKVSATCWCCCCCGSLSNGLRLLILCLNWMFPNGFSVLVRTLLLLLLVVFPCLYACTRVCSCVCVTVVVNLVISGEPLAGDGMWH